MNKNPWRSTIATSFADPADVARYRAAKARGRSDREAFKYGDNGRGKWGADTTAPFPMVALPPDDWMSKSSNPAGMKVLVKRGGQMIEAELQDTMPWRENIRNGAGIDLNPKACSMLGIEIPARATVEWKWKDETAPEGITPGELIRLLIEIVIRPFKRKK